MTQIFLRKVYSFLRTLDYYPLEILHLSCLDRIESIENLNGLASRIKSLKNRLREYPFSQAKKIIILTNVAAFHNFSKSIGGLEVCEISENEMAESNFSYEKFPNLFKNSIIFLTNNSVNKVGYEKLCKIKENSPSAYFIIQDWDSHHWLNMSQKVMRLADVYVPTHLDSNLLSSRLALNTTRFIPPGTSQWSKEFLMTHLEEIENSKRFDVPLGMHSYYANFKYRNDVIKNLSEYYANIGFTKTGEQDVRYHDRSEEQRLSEWISFKIHWIVPVLNDLPIRFFDALVTGGIPIVPSSLRGYLSILNIPSDFFILYSPSDVHRPQDIVELALNRFDNQGAEGIRRRVKFCLENFHSEKIIDLVISEVKNILST